MVLDLGTEPELFASVGGLDLGGDFSAEVFERVLWIASRIAAEGREGRPIGTIFVLGDSNEVLAQSRQLVLNPLQGHPESGRNIVSLELEETLKEFATIDGAFIVRATVSCSRREFNCKRSRASHSTSQPDSARATRPPRPSRARPKLSHLRFRNPQEPSRCSSPDAS